MDSVSSSDDGDWAEWKELEKNERYTLHRYFINYLRTLKKKPWNCLQINFTVGAHGSLKITQFQERLHLLGVTNSKARNIIRALTVSKTIVFSDIILKLFYVSILCSPEWALSSLPTDLANAQKSPYHLFKKTTGPSCGLVREDNSRRPFFT